MNDDKWIDLKIKIKEKFNDVKESTDKKEREDDVGHVITSVIETLEFISPLGELKIERITRPKIIDKKTHYHKGAGAGKVEFITSEDETTSVMNIFKKGVTGDWEKLELPAESISF